MVVPKIIHYVWFDFSNDGSGKNPPENYINQINKCKALNPDYKIYIWSRPKAILFMEQFFPEYVEMFMNYKYEIQRVDAIRYFVLYIFGGIYMDMDIKCLKPFGDLFNENKVYLVQDSNYSKYFSITGKFNNFFMVSNPKNPFWLILHSVLVQNKNVTAMTRATIILESTGLYALEKAFDACPEQIKPLVLDKKFFNPCNLCNECDISQSYIIHDSDKKWTTIFEKTSVWLYCNFCKTWIFVLLLIFVILFFIYKKMKC